MKAMEIGPEKLLYYVGREQAFYFNVPTFDYGNPMNNALPSSCNVKNRVQAIPRIPCGTQRNGNLHPDMKANDVRTLLSSVLSAARNSPMLRTPSLDHSKNCSQTTVTTKMILNIINKIIYYL